MVQWRQVLRALLPWPWCHSIPPQALSGLRRQISYPPLKTTRSGQYGSTYSHSGASILFQDASCHYLWCTVSV